MATRTESAPPSPIERATEGVMAKLNVAIADEATKHRVSHKDLRRILAGYFERKTIREWCEDIGAELPHHERLRGE